MHSWRLPYPRQFSTRILRNAGLAALFLLAMVILWQAHRPDPATGQERSDRLAGALDAGHTLEQTFIAGRDSLCAIDVFPRIPPGRLSSRYTLTVRLREAGATRDLAASRFRLVDARARQRITLAFSPQSHSRGKMYLLRIETDAPADTVSLLSSAEDAYPHGELFQDGQPTTLDLTFRAHTAIVPLALAGELAESAPEFGLLIGFTLLFGIAGASFLTLLNAWPAGGIAERALWSVGVGLALAPLVFLLMGDGAIWVFAGLLLLAIARLWQAWRKNQRTVITGFSRNTSRQVDWAIPLLFLWALAVRLLQIRDILVPPWIDGLTHIQMAQSIIDAGRMPGGLLYHIGFHVQVVMLGNLTGLPLPSLLVLFGQLISALCGPALYVLVMNMPSSTEPGPTPFTRNTALLSSMTLTVFPSLPSYLINWGRYPFMLGLALLPFTLSATIAALRQAPGRATSGRYILLATLMGGQLLSHYGTLSFWLSFTIIFLAVERPTWIRHVRLRQAAVVGLALLVLGLVAGYLRFGDNLAGNLTAAITESRQVSEELDYASIWQINLRAGGLWLVMAGACGAVWAAFKSRRILLLSAGWFIAQAALITLQSPLLGYALASYANLLLALPLPLAVLTGSLLTALLSSPEKSPAAKPGPTSPLAVRVIRGDRFWSAAALILLTAAGGLSQIGIVNPTTLLYSLADQKAMDWIRTNLPIDTHILINSRFWSTGKIVPADGGGWIPAMTARETVYIENKDELAHLPETLAKKEITHIYLGRFSGFLGRTIFEQDPARYPRIYHEDGIDIYAVNSAE